MVTCLYSRSVHLELLTSLGITSLKLALRRFTALRGECTLYRSDCGTNFVGARNLDLDDERKLVSLAEGFVLYEWKFLPPHASHFSGVWERKVGAIKSVFGRTNLFQSSGFELYSEVVKFYQRYTKQFPSHIFLRFELYSEFGEIYQQHAPFCCGFSGDGGCDWSGSVRQQR